MYIYVGVVHTSERRFYEANRIDKLISGDELGNE